MVLKIIHSFIHSFPSCSQLVQSWFINSVSIRSIPKACHTKIHLISAGCPRNNIALLVQNCGLKNHSSFIQSSIHSFSFIHSFIHSFLASSCCSRGMQIECNVHHGGTGNHTDNPAVSHQNHHPRPTVTTVQSVRRKSVRVSLRC